MKIIGHRGARGLAPENTLASISAALDHHVDEVEFDVRVTKDGIPVLSHDPALTVGEREYSIAHHNLEQLRQYKPDLATLDEVLEFIGGKCHAHIEVKPAEPVQAIVKAVDKFLKRGTCSISDLSFASFDQKILLALHTQLPDVGVVVIERWSGVRAVWRARQLHTRRLSMNQRWLWRGFLKSMYRRGYQLTPYTINNPGQASKWQAYLYGIITDYPDRFTK